jgi:hypothetical protein
LVVEKQRDDDQGLRVVIFKSQVVGAGAKLCKS